MKKKNLNLKRTFGTYTTWDVCSARSCCTRMCFRICVRIMCVKKIEKMWMKKKTKKKIWQLSLNKKIVNLKKIVKKNIKNDETIKKMQTIATDTNK